MIGIIIVTHGNLALELRNAMEHIIGPQKKIALFAQFPMFSQENHVLAIFSWFAAR